MNDLTIYSGGTGGRTMEQNEKKIAFLIELTLFT